MLVWLVSIAALGEVHLALYLPVTAACVVLIDASPRRPSLFSLPLGIAPMVAACWTAPRGDGDGLWALVLPLLACWSIVLFALPHIFQTPRRFISARHGKIGSRFHTPLITILLIMASGTMCFFRLQGPWINLERSLNSYTPPTGMSVIDRERSGDAMCDTSCGAQVTLILNSDSSASRQCDLLKESIDSWNGVSNLITMEDAVGDYDDETVFCRYFFTRSSGGSSRHMDGAVIQVEGDPPQARVTSYDERMAWG